MKDRIRVTPSAPAPNYAPAYLAEDLGFFTQEDLDVDATVYAGPGASWLADNLLAGKADIALGGIWIPLMYRARIAAFTIFAMVCNRNPQVVMSRAPIGQFTWKDMYDKKFLLPMSATSQWMFLEGVMLEDKADRERIKFIRDLDGATMARLWSAGFGDFYLTKPPESEAFEDQGYFIATTIAKSGGLVPWSVYYTTPEFVERPGRLVTRFARAIQRSLDWIHSHQPLEVARVVHHRFPHVSLEALTRSIGRLREWDVWADTIRVPEASFNRYQGMIARYGLINEPLPFTQVVSPDVADEVASS